MTITRRFVTNTVLIVALVIAALSAAFLGWHRQPQPKVLANHDLSKVVVYYMPDERGSMDGRGSVYWFPKCADNGKAVACPKFVSKCTGVERTPRECDSDTRPKDGDAKQGSTRE